MNTIHLIVRMRSRFVVICLGLFCVLSATDLCLAEDVSTAAQFGSVTIDPAFGNYERTPGIAGNVNSIGSDTLNNLMTLWGERFREFYPNVRIQIEGKGSGTAPPALIAGTAQLGPMSREMKSSEIDDFEKKFGYKPTAIRVAVDALGVFVNKDNPISGLSLLQLDAVFSKTRKQGYAVDISTWGGLGLSGSWAQQPIGLYGRNSASGTYGFFKEHVLGNGDFRDTVKEQPGSASVVQSVAVDRYGIGYSGIGYKTSGVRAVPLKAVEGERFVEATQENAYSGEYPLARFLFVYLNKAPGAPLDALVREFIEMILSRQGQEVVIKDGYFPITTEWAKDELRKIE